MSVGWEQHSRGLIVFPLVEAERGGVAQMACDLDAPATIYKRLLQSRFWQVAVRLVSESFLNDDSGRHGCTSMNLILASLLGCCNIHLSEEQEKDVHFEQSNRMECTPHRDNSQNLHFSWISSKINPDEHFASHGSWKWKWTGSGKEEPLSLFMQYITDVSCG